MEDSYRKKMGLGQDGNALIQLIILNAVMFVILKFIFSIYLLTSMSTDAYNKSIFQWFVFPAEIGKLSARPWTVLTYMFCDDSVFRFIANMLWFWGFGYILQDLAGNKKLIPVYVYGGLAGAAFFILSYNIFPKLQLQQSTAFLIGACQCYRHCHSNYYCCSGLQDIPNDQRRHSIVGINVDVYPN